MEVDSNCNIINNMLLKNIPSEYQKQYSFLVHFSIYPMVHKYLTRSGIEILQQLGSYELTVGTFTFDMEILVLGSQSRSSTSFAVFEQLCETSQFTYFWDKQINLFREVDRYYQLEEFIASNDLNKHIISVKEISGINSLGAPIKLVTFDSTIHRGELLKDFDRFLFTNGYRAPQYRQIYHYYFTNALPWHQPDMFRLYSIPFRNQRIFLGLQTFLTCMRELSYSREPHLDLIGLCSLKLAFCDDRNVTEASSDLEYEIDALVERFLRRMKQKQTYIRNGNFSLNEYATDTNSSFNTSYPAIPYFVYTFQHFFQRTNLPALGRYTSLQSNEFTNTLKLIDKKKDYNILLGTSLRLIGSFCENMNSKLFSELLKCDNVRRIHLDTNYKWIPEPYLFDLGGFDKSKWVAIELVGKNRFNFIEDFLQFLKTIPICLTFQMTIIIDGATLRSYDIFKNLEVVQLMFRGTNITYDMLTELSDGLITVLKIDFEECTIENRTCTWSVLINGFNRKFVKALIFEGENTWQYLFESIANHLTKFKLNEFKFEYDLMIQCQNYKTIFVRDIKFMFNEFKTKLEMRDLDGQKVDFYYLRNFGVYNETNFDYKNFEFYQ